MLLAFPHEDEAVHFIALVVSEIVAFQPAIGHIQDPTHLVIFRGLKRLLDFVYHLPKTESDDFYRG